MHISGVFSKSRFCSHDLVASAIVMALRLCDGRKVVISCSYMLTAQRAMHSPSSAKSSVAMFDFSASTSPASTCSIVCERRKFQRHCGMESLALNVI